MGCHTEPAARHIAHVLEKLHFFQFFNFFKIIYTTYRSKKNCMYLLQKNQFFFIIYTTYRKKKLHAFTAKNITQLDDFFVRDLHFSRPTLPTPRGR